MSLAHDKDNVFEYLSGNSLDDVLDDNITIEQAVIPDEPAVTKAIEHIMNNPPVIQDMLKEIDRVNEYGWSRGTMGLDFGFESLNKAFRGFNPGLHLVAGGANTGN